MDKSHGKPTQARPDHPLDEIVAGIAEGFIAFDNDWCFTYVNAAAERMAGLPASAVLGKPVLDALNIDRTNPFHLAYTASKASGQPVAFSAYADLVKTWVEVRGYPYPGGYAVLFRDVSEERRLHRATLELRRRLEAADLMNRRIFESSLDLILVVDRKGNIARISPSVGTTLGYQPEEVVGRNAEAFLQPEDLELTRNEMRLARSGRLLRNFVSRCVHRDGRIVPVSWTGVWLEPEQQHFFIGRDMTEHIAAEERQRRSQRLEAVGQLTGGIAHDFNNLLSVVIGNLDLLEDRLRVDPVAGPLAARALDAALRGAELTRQLLAFASRQPLDAKVVAINERVSGTMDLLRRTLGEQIKIVTSLAPDLWPTTVDPVQFESALVNLAINARDAMRGVKNGRLYIETANYHLDEDYVRANPEVTPGDYVMVAVTDTGAGMTPDILAHVFEPFFTTKPPGEGTGLGLSMVYGFIRQSQGHIKIYSEAGVGTTVRFFLPRADGDAALSPSESAIPASAAGSGERILVVEDNPDVRRVVVAQLESLGYATIEAETADAALAILDQDETIDLMFTDIVMPGRMNGIELARVARAARPELKVLLTTGFAKAAIDGGQIVDDELRHLLSKPYRKMELAAKLRAVLEGAA
ncbi:MAG: PAS domain S-box protein [Candidatus Eiseniibacteriota bacterium]